MKRQAKTHTKIQQHTRTIKNIQKNTNTFNIYKHLTKHTEKYLEYETFKIYKHKQKHSKNTQHHTKNSNKIQKLTKSYISMFTCAST